jgi:HEPN domain-containing protein
MPPEGPADVAAAWLRKAEGDERALEILERVAEPPLDVICFHAQQMAWKCLKALLAGRAVPFPKTHDLRVLARLASPPLALEPDDEALVELSYLAVASRYPGEPDETTVEVAARAVATARKVRAMTLGALGLEDADG